MTTRELTDYVENELKNGEQKDAIKARLLQNGWSGDDVEEALRVVEGKTAGAENVPVSVSLFIVSPPTQTSFWDFIYKKVYKNRREKIYDFLFSFFIYLFFTILLLYFLPIIMPDFLRKYDKGFVFLPGLYTLLTFGLSIYLLLKRKYMVLGIISIFFLILLFYLFLFFTFSL